MQLGINMGWCVCLKRYVICVVYVHNIFCEYRLLLGFLEYSYFLSLDLSKSKVRSLGWLGTDMGLMYHLAEHQKQCNRNLRFNTVTELLLSSFIVYHYGCKSFNGETIGIKYLFHLPSVYGVKCHRWISK